jgi:hypothetical protein
MFRRSDISFFLDRRAHPTAVLVDSLTLLTGIFVIAQACTCEVPLLRFGNFKTGPSLCALVAFSGSWYVGGREGRALVEMARLTFVSFLACVTWIARWSEMFHDVRVSCFMSGFGLGYVGNIVSWFVGMKLYM